MPVVTPQFGMVDQFSFQIESGRLLTVGDFGDDCLDTGLCQIVVDSSPHPVRNHRGAVAQSGKNWGVTVMIGAMFFQSQGMAGEQIGAKFLCQNLTVVSSVYDKAAGSSKMRSDIPAVVSGYGYLHFFSTSFR